MTLDTNRLQHVLFLATGTRVSADEASKLADLLDVSEEILPHVLLRRDGFRDHPDILAALKAAKASSPGRITTPRKPQTSNALRLKAAETELAAAIKSAIDHDLGARDGHARFDGARRALTNQLPANSGDAGSRIQR